jgi:two-component system, LytTR family, sensor kinase
MKPPADRRLDANGTGVDLPAPARPRYGLQWPLVLLVAAILSVVSSALALQFTLASGKPATYWRSIVVLNCGYWFLWALFTPAIVWLSQHFRLERQGLLLAVLVHLPGVALFSFAHIAAMGALQWWLAASAGRSFSWWLEVKRSALQNFDWEMMTYWAIAGLSHAVLYYRASRDRELRASQLETRLIEAQMATLQQQLQPHFLFNTLNTITALIATEPRAAERMVAGLSELLRASLRLADEQEVPLARELDHLRLYVDIQQTRFGDRLAVAMDVDPAVRGALVPSLLLQPLVENAIRHGITPRASGGRISVRASRDADELRLEVRDDGVGAATHDGVLAREGVGLTNTRERLRRLHGARHRFAYESRVGSGFSVRIAVPFRTEGGGGA